MSCSIIGSSCFYFFLSCSGQFFFEINFQPLTRKRLYAYLLFDLHIMGRPAVEPFIEISLGTCNDINEIETICHMMVVLGCPKYFGPLVLTPHPRNNSFPISLNGKAHDTAVVLGWLEFEMSTGNALLSVPDVLA